MLLAGVNRDFVSDAHLQHHQNFVAGTTSIHKHLCDFEEYLTQLISDVMCHPVCSVTLYPCKIGFNC